MADMETLKWYVQNGDLETLKATKINTDTDVGAHRTLLHCAADYGQTDVLKYLLDLKVIDVNASDNHGLTPLLCAVFEGHVECVKLLLKYDADKSVKAPSGESAVEAAETEEIKKLLR